MVMGMYSRLNACNVLQALNLFWRTMGAKAINPIIGKISVVDFDRIRVSDHYVGIRDIPRGVKNALKVGTEVVVRFPDHSGYYAKEIDIKEEGVTPVEDISELIKKATPTIPQQILTNLSQDEANEFFEEVKVGMDLAAKLYDISATFDDTKKDLSDMMEKVIPAGISAAVLIDNNTKQILKKSLERNEKTEKK